MNAILKREFRSYMHNATGFVFLSCLLLVAGLLCVAMNVLLGSSRFEDSLYYLQIALIVLIPLLTMRTMTEEKRAHTDQLLYSLPLPLWKIVLGKYLAMVAVFGIACAIIALYPLLFGLFGMTGMGTAYSSIFGFFLLGSALIAFSMFFSSLAETPLIAMIICVVATAVLFCVDMFVALLSAVGAVGSLVVLIVLALLVALIVWLVTKHATLSAVVALIGVAPQVIVFAINSSLYDGLLYRVASSLALFYRFTVFTRGIFDLTTLIYDISFAALFLYLTYQAMEKRRWS